MMSLAFSSREVPEGSTVGLHGDVVVSPLAYVSKKRVTSGSQDDDDDGKREGFSCFSPAYYLKKGIIEEDDGNDLSEVIGDSPKRRDNGFCFARDRSEELSELSSESSSIVVAGESDLCTSTTVDAEYDDGEEVESKLKDGALGSLGCLEESLPIKRGLSNNFSGRSKSFANLSDVNTVEDLAKPENPFNKRRRTLMASKWSRKSFYTCLNPTTSMPLLAALNEDEGEDDQLQQDHHHHHHHHHHDSDSEDDSAPSLPLPRKNLNNFKSSRCFSLTDLQQQNPDKY